MNEIKFLAWDTEDKKMSLPFTLQSLLNDIAWYDVCEIWLRYGEGIGEYWEVHADDFGEKGRFKLRRCTGLKDRNAVEIYEGDIVRAGFGGNLVGTIVFGMHRPVMNTDQWEGHQGFYIEWHNWDGMTRGDLGYWLTDMETQACVIGNVYKNPDLLETDKEAL